jgi:hypothetical protein
MKGDKVRKIVQFCLDFILLGISTAVCGLLIFMWIYAYSHNLIPKGEWGVNEGNHGPWRGRIICFFISPFLGYSLPVCVLRKILNWIFLLQFLSIPLSAGCLFIDRHLTWKILLVLNVIYFYALGYEYYWLID